jgi:methylated-DNA-[protein]-cysteine S-methyltransferase
VAVFDQVMTRLWSTVAPTALGAIGVVWGENGIVQTWLHAGTAERAKTQIRRAFPRAVATTPSAAVAATVADILALMDGVPRDLRGAELDMRSVPEFDRRVYAVTRTIPPGSILTYGAIAKALGEEPMRARDVGQALARNPFAPIVPCHRVVAAGGRLGGYSAPGGASTTRRLLALEGADIGTAPQQPGLFDDQST